MSEMFCPHGYVLDDAPHPAAGLEACPHGCTAKIGTPTERSVMNDATKKALDVLVAIAENEDNEPDARIRAAATILGDAKTPEPVREGVSA